MSFETRIPAVRAWEGWHGLRSSTDVEGIGEVTELLEVTEVAWPLIRFRCTNHFVADDVDIISDSTLRYRELAEVRDDLGRHGFEVVDVRDASDRSGREWVFLARRID